MCSHLRLCKHLCGHVEKRTPRPCGQARDFLHPALAVGCLACENDGHFPERIPVVYTGLKWCVVCGPGEKSRREWVKTQFPEWFKKG